MQSWYCPSTRRTFQVLCARKFRISAAKRLIWDAETVRAGKDRKAASRRRKENVAPMKVRAPVLYVGFRLHFGDDGFKMSERLLDGERVHFTSDSFARLKRRLQIVAGNFKGQRIGDGPACAFFVLDPCRMRERHPDFSSAHQELDIHGVGMA